jgi:formylglycine-generating enzyme required for sulfatase activity
MKIKAGIYQPNGILNLKYPIRNKKPERFVSTNQVLNTLLFFIPYFLFLIFSSCQQEEPPTGGNQIQMGSTASSTVAYYTAQVSSTPGSVKGNKIIQHGHCWGTAAIPTVEGSKTALGSLTEAQPFTSELTGLAPNTTYFVRPYLTTDYETIYGTESTVKTLKTGIPAITTLNPDSITTASIKSGGTLVSDSGLVVTEYGLVWDTAKVFSVDKNLGKLVNSGARATYTHKIANLADGVKYHIKAFAKNTAGVGYGNTIEFTTVGIIAPTVTTTAATNIATTTAQTGGNVTSDGNSAVTARGVVWNTTGNPTVESNSGKTGNGNGPGVYTSQLTNLQEGVTYYVRAYATNGKTSGYGNAIEFTTIKRTLAEVTTTAITTFTTTTAVLGGNVTNDGNASVTERGVVYATTQNPTTSNSKLTIGTGTGSFSNTVTGLTANTTYYVRAYATNSKGTGYGNTVEFTTSTILEKYGMVLVQGGTFQMGSTTGHSDEKPVHSVTLSSFYISKYEVTQALWQEVMGSNPSYFKGSNFPVEHVSWNDVQTFITKLNQQTGLNFRLPTEAEWEYAARGGASTSSATYAGSDNIDEVAWYGSNSGNTTHPVGQKKANKLGLYDLSGNVYEWCADWYGAYSSAAQTNPTGSATASGYGRVIRGGGWDEYDSSCRVAFRRFDSPDNTLFSEGFRLARSL